MSGEKIPLGGNHGTGFYSGSEQSGGEPGSSGFSRRILRVFTIISALVACGCSIYGIFEAKNAVIILPFIVVVLWLIIHFLILIFSRHEKEDFNPPAWFIFVSGGHIFIQSLIVIILTLVNQSI